jgi:aminoglycoside phosphotransferase (APT) family kinase protein
MSKRVPAEIDVPKLQSWLDQELGDHECIEVEALQGGGSCEVFSVRRGGEHWVLRRPPATSSSSTAHDVLREYTILNAVKDEKVRIARPVVACNDPEVAGSVFYLMDFVDGVPIRHQLPEVFVNSPADQALALTELIDALAEVHNVDWRACGLQDIGKTEGYLER